MAFKTGNIGIIVDFLQAYGDLNIINYSGHTPIAFGNDDLLRKLNQN
jgi:hypothetical protein